MLLNIFVPPPPSLDKSIQKEIERVKEITKDKNLKKSKEKLSKNSLVTELETCTLMFSLIKKMEMAKCLSKKTIL